MTQTIHENNGRCEKMLKNISPFKSAIAGAMALSVVVCGGGSGSGLTSTEQVNIPPVANAIAVRKMLNLDP